MMVIDSFTHDFGEVKPGTPLRHIFKVKNEGKADLLINNVSPSCGCTKGEFDKVVPPGQEGKIELAIERTEGYSGEMSKSANVSTNDPKNSSFNLILRARFKSSASNAPPASGPLNPNAVLTVEPVDRVITSSLTGSSSSSTLYISNPQPTPVHARNVISGGTAFTATLSTIQEGKRYQLNITSNPGLKAGHYVQTVKVITDSAVQPEVKIELDLTVYPKVLASPASILMPTLSVASDLATINWPTIFVRKLREKGFQITSYTSTLRFLKLDMTTETEGQAYKIRITLDPAKIKPGDFKGTIQIKTNDADVPVVDVPVQISFR